MQKHFFTFRKIVNGKPAPIYIEVIVAETVSRKEARVIAEQEIDEFRAGVKALHQEIDRRQKSIKSIPDYRYVGVN